RERLFFANLLPGWLEGESNASTRCEGFIAAGICRFPVVWLHCQRESGGARTSSTLSRRRLGGRTLRAIRPLAPRLLAVPELNEVASATKVIIEAGTRGAPCAHFAKPSAVRRGFPARPGDLVSAQGWGRAGRFAVCSSAQRYWRA